MSFNTDIDDEIFRPVTRLSKGFALRDLIAGAEFEIREDSCQDVDEEDHFRDSKYSPEEVEDYINLSALDLDADESNKIISFPELRKQMSPITSDGKVMKLIKRPGAGNVVNKDSVVYVHYSAYANLDEIPFDNSYLRRKRPERLQLGVGSILIGLELALRTMKKGEKSQFLIDPDYAFGDKGCPPRIPPEATVLYEVELFNITDIAPAEQPENLQNEDRHSFSYISKIAKRNHVSGNDLFKQKNEKAAIAKYKKAVDLLLDCRLKDEEEEAEQKKLLLKLYTNLSVCYMKIKRPERVCIVVREAMYVNEVNARKNAKLLFNWGSALVMLGEYKRAAEHLRSALRLEPNNRTIKDEISKLERKKSQYAEQEKISFQKAFGYKPLKSEPVQTVNDPDDDVNAELKELIKKNIEYAKSGKPVKVNFMPEVIDKVEELCKSMITEADSLMVEQVRGAIVISKVGDSK